MPDHTSQRPRYQLGRIKRRKTGCITCRWRHVKCDESKPSCQKCTSTGRKCDGYSSLPFTREDFQTMSIADRSSGRAESDHATTLIHMVTDQTFQDTLEKRYFQYFRQKTVPSTNCIINCRFWDRVVLQLCHTEPAVKYAVLALSSLHQLNDGRERPEAAQQHQVYALRQYDKAIVAARQLLQHATEDSIERVLAACVVFVCYENVHGNVMTSQVHMSSGRAILTQYRSKLDRLSRRQDVREIQDFFCRLDIPAIGYYIGSPYAYTLQDFLNTAPNLAIGDFWTEGEARGSLIDHVRWALILMNEADASAETGRRLGHSVLEASQARLLVQLSMWIRQFDKAVPRLVTAPSALILTLRLWHLTVTLTVENLSPGPETRFDAHYAKFAKILAYSAEVIESLAKDPDKGTFGCDLGIAIPMFTVVQRCRDPFLRRRALSLLRLYGRREGPWDSAGAAAVAERWMQCEEAGLERSTCAGDIPEANRLRSMDVKLDMERPESCLYVEAAGPAEKVQHGEHNVNDLIEMELFGREETAYDRRKSGPNANLVEREGRVWQDVKMRIYGHNRPFRRSLRVTT